ncbi:MAG: Cof-type HAD-IIB family hydrolase [Coriobacteriales bacterium]|jgi:hydroxymethylpyrimidine pyrophosphatase-like HAD family hydrolase|nr:Cof-type HAD-IIB family hydrolase [Coriobacteriales bacterium]
MDDTASTLNLARIDSPEAAHSLKSITHVYTDLDGTLFAPGGRLLTNHAGAPSTATAEALTALRRAGIEVIIVTGRAGQGGNELLRLLALNTFIGEMGAFVQEGTGAAAQTRYELGSWAGIVLAEGLKPGELPKNTTPRDLIVQSGVITRLEAAFPGRLCEFRPYPSSVSTPMMGYIDENAARKLLAEEQLPLQLLDNGIIHPQKHALVDCAEIHIYHLLPQGSSKAAAVSADIARRGLKREQTLAIGDSLGDVAMGEAAGTLVVVQNATHSAWTARALAERIQQNSPTFITEGSTADGWSEFASALLAAQG